jgi:hypothetical protein
VVTGACVALVPDSVALKSLCRVVRSGAECSTIIRPYAAMTQERIRLTITVSPEVHEVFSRMAASAGLSLGKCMGDWLADTIEGAQFVASKMEEARKAPALVMREMHAASRGLTAQIEADQALMRARTASGKRSAPPAARRGSPPPSNTGGKVTRKGAGR